MALIGQSSPNNIVIAAVSISFGVFCFFFGLVMLILSIHGLPNRESLAEFYEISTGAFGGTLLGIGMALLIFGGAMVYYDKNTRDPKHVMAE